MWERVRTLHRGIDRQAAAALITCAVAVTALQYFAKPLQLEAAYPSLSGLGAWIARDVVRLVAYVLVPLIVARAFGLRASDLGLRVAGLGQHLWIYAALYAAILPLLVAVSYSSGFQRTYPLYKLAGVDLGHLAGWWLVYGVSFFTVELFYRGFLLAMLRPAFGVNAVYVMMVPYVMIHFAKPLAETCGAIVAAIVLGYLALITRSIWLGVLIHVSVAFTIDLLSLAHQGLLRGLWSR